MNRNIAGAGWVTCVFFFILIGICSCQHSGERECFSDSTGFITAERELDNNFLIQDDSTIIFSANDSSSFSLYQFKGGQVAPLNSFSKNVFKPFMLAGNIAALADQYGDEVFRCTSSELKPYIHDEPIEVIYSSTDGTRIIVHMKYGGEVFLINTNKKSKLPITKAKKLHGASFADHKSFLILSYENKLVYVNERNGELIPLATSTADAKLNPFLYGDDVYFSNNNASEYYQLFSVNLKHPELAAMRVHDADHDLRMPRRRGNDLYFIAVIRNEYLLKKLDLLTKEVTSITTKGVVYNFEFYGDSSIVYTYSDLVTPKALMVFNEQHHSARMIAGSGVNLNISSKRIRCDSTSSWAYELKASGNKSSKGVILFLHPGLHSDFSPRWDVMLMNLCHRGYAVVAPDYPMSSGHGKTFHDKDIFDAVQDLQRWKAFIRTTYQDLPLYYVAASSGNSLMERLLLADAEPVAGAVSLFGIPSVSNFHSPVPVLYILGENDPYVNFEKRMAELHSDNDTSSTEIRSYPHEGHWFRSRRNEQDAVHTVLNFFCRAGSVSR